MRSRVPMTCARQTVSHCARVRRYFVYTCARASLFAPSVQQGELMKRLLSAAMLLAFSAAIVGCEAHAKVGDPDNDVNTTSGTRTHTSSSTYEKKTTTIQPDGDTSTKT